MRQKFAILAIALIFSIGVTVHGQTRSIELFDGRSGSVKYGRLSTADGALVEADVRKRAKDGSLKAEVFADFNWKEEFSIDDVAEGAFTKPGANERALLYRYSYTNGVVILSDGDIVAHYSGGPGDYAFYIAIKSLPDVNKNGLSEIILLRNVEDSEDIIPYLFEVKDGAPKFIGEAGYFDSGYEAGDGTNAEKTKQRAYRAIVKPSKTPEFWHETYERNGSKGKWRLAKKAEKFSWEDRGGEYNMTRIDSTESRQTPRISEDQYIKGR